MPDQHFFQKVCRYGAEYRDWLLLNNPPTDVLLNDWWQAYQFFLGRAFYQGRSDIVSGMVHERALEVLKSEEFFGENPDEARYLKLKEQNWQTLEKALQEKIGKGMVGKGGDVRMVISSLEYLSKCPGLNIVRHIYQKIKTTEDEDRVEDLYHELQGIKQVGPKISSFFLRDVLNLFHNELEPLLPPRAYLYLQPFDTWVKQLSQDAGIVDKEDSPERAIRKIVVSCREAGVSPVLFNQGLWKIGSQKISLNPLLNQA